jgi:hypothetical protein
MDNANKWGPELSSVPLLEAVLCADCEIISNSAGERCEICGSPSLLSLGRVLGGRIEGQRATLVQVDRDSVRHGFTVLVNPDSTRILQQQRRRRTAVVDQQQSLPMP